MPTPDDYELQYNADILSLEIPDDTSLLAEIYQEASAEFAAFEAGELRQSILDSNEFRALAIIALFRGMETIYARYAPDTDDEGELFEFRSLSTAGKSVSFSRTLFVALRLAHERPSALSDELQLQHKAMFAKYFKG